MGDNSLFLSNDDYKRKKDLASEVFGLLKKKDVLKICFQEKHDIFINVIRPGDHHCQGKKNKIFFVSFQKGMDTSESLAARQSRKHTQCAERGGERKRKRGFPGVSMPS